MLPDIKRELDDINVNPFDAPNKLVFEDLINCINYDENGVADLGDGVQVKRGSGEFRIIESGVELTKFADRVRINMNNYNTWQVMEKERQAMEGQIQTEEMNLDYDLAPVGYDPPDFGVTVLGAGHGFDSCGGTSGYILWIDGRGIMIDPPPFSSAALRRYGITPHLIDKIILTHCHADHDAGTFNKIFSSSPVDFITTPTIMNSFVRKYAATADMTEKELLSLFDFR
jgi:hypothetical protein